MGNQTLSTLKNFSFKLSPIELTLRIGIFGTFLGHGIYALLQKQSWLPFLTFWGFTKSVSLDLMIVIGILDVVVAISSLLRPMRSLLIYATIWAFFTALMRPLSGGEWLDFIERSANWTAPLALLLLKKAKELKNRNFNELVLENH